MRAWRDTKRSYGLTWGTAFRSLLVPAAAVGLIYLFHGIPEAMNEASMILLYLLAAAAAGFLPLFSWNLWLAPYRILHDRVDAIANVHHVSKTVDLQAERRATLNVKKHDALQEMKALRRCIALDDRSDSFPRRGPTRQDCKHLIPTLRKKYTDWIPYEYPKQSPEDWISRIIAILSAYDYEKADTIIKDAAVKGSWGD